MKKFIVLCVLWLLHLPAFYGQPINEDDYEKMYRLIEHRTSSFLLDYYAVEDSNGVTKLFNHTTDSFKPESYTHFGTNGNYFWGLHNDYWHFGDADSATIEIKIDASEIQHLEFIGDNSFITKRNGTSRFLLISTYKKDYSFVDCEDFDSVHCKEYNNHVIVSKTFRNGKTKYGCMSVFTGEFVSDVFADEMITCPRAFDAIAMIKQNNTYRLYDFIADSALGHTYTGYKMLPIYDTPLGIYNNGVEFINKNQLYSFEVGRVQKIEFKSTGDFVYAALTTEKGTYKLDIWNKRLIK
jgi:hypothetical protein